ncbi:MAG TPA: hypothetical protein VEO53_03875 [Candidatus Binatia bacterium]|nr:hypothetical protein [Candidatus Binatia bacterium]
MNAVLYPPGSAGQPDGFLRPGSCFSWGWAQPEQRVTRRLDFVQRPDEKEEQKKS